MANTGDGQLEGLNRLLAEILPRNRFYAGKLAGVHLPLTWQSFRTLPFTSKAELVADAAAHPPLGSIATFEPERYVTYHQTSGTTGRPLMVVDTAESWDWWLRCWLEVYRAAGVTRHDRVFFAFSFGPFIGFWSAFEACRRLGAMTIPGGALDSKGRLALMRSAGATVLLCTVTYALRLTETAEVEGIPLKDLGVRRTIHAGEPGASIPAVRARIESAWGAQAFDHAGATEVGAYAYSCERRDGLHLNEAEFVAEVLDEGGAPVPEGASGELVLTNLGRAGWPVIRYRTGDRVQNGGRACPCGRPFLKLPGGLVGRLDDMLVVRGINVFPSAIEACVRELGDMEFRLVRTRLNGMDEVTVELEGTPELAQRLADRLRQALSLRLPTRAVPPASLPRFELKARRIVDLR